MHISGSKLEICIEGGVNTVEQFSEPSQLYAVENSLQALLSVRKKAVILLHVIIYQYSQSTSFRNNGAELKQVYEGLWATFTP